MGPGWHVTERVFKRYLLSTGRAPGTANTYANNLSIFWRWCCDQEINAWDADRSAVREWVGERLAGVSASRAHNDLAALRQFYACITAHLCILIGEMNTESRRLLFSVSINDCRIETFRSGGPGGQNQNKVASGVRLIHEPSGAVGQARDDRSQFTNKKLAFKRMCADPKFQLWLKMCVGSELLADEPPVVYVPPNFKPIPPALLAEAMKPENLKVETLQDGRWVTVN